MNIPRESVPLSVVERLLSSAANAGNGDTHVFRAHSRLRLIPDGFVLFVAAVFISGLLTARTPVTRYVLVAIGVVLALLLAANIAKIVWNARIGRAVALLMPRFLVVLDEDGVELQPVWDFKTAEISEVLNHSFLCFEFVHGRLVIPYNVNQQAMAETFVQQLLGYAVRAQGLLADLPLKERLARNSWAGFGDADPFPEFPPEAKYGLVKEPDSPKAAGWTNTRKHALIASAATALVLLFAVPVIVDYNAFQWAVKQGTATAYREYLAEPRNLRYREDARRAITSLYDHEIERYASRVHNLVGAEAFVTMLRYLRDENLFTVPVAFQSASAVADVVVPGRPKLISVEPSFSAEKNRERERAVVRRIKETLGRFFPADIVTVESWHDQPGPRIEVSYQYRNKPGALYYRTSERTVDPRSRTWYHGVEIQWKLSLYLPDAKDPAHRFSFRSEPAPNFSVRASRTGAVEAGSVYERMVETAFDDFVRRFNADFLTVEHEEQGP